MATTATFIAPSISLPSASTALPEVSTLVPKTRLSNGIVVYRDVLTVGKVEYPVNRYPTIWAHQGFVRLTENDWMEIKLWEEWQFKISVKGNV